MKQTTKQWFWFLGLYIAALAVFGIVEFGGHDLVQMLIAK